MGVEICNSKMKTSESESEIFFATVYFVYMYIIILKKPQCVCI